MLLLLSYYLLATLLFKFTSLYLSLSSIYRFIFLYLSILYRSILYLYRLYRFSKDHNMWWLPFPLDAWRHCQWAPCRAPLGARRFTVWDWRWI